MLPWLWLSFVSEATGKEVEYFPSVDFIDPIEIRDIRGIATPFVPPSPQPSSSSSSSSSSSTCVSQSDARRRAADIMRPKPKTTYHWSDGCDAAFFNDATFQYLINIGVSVRK